MRGGGGGTVLEEVVVRGIRGSLQNAIEAKRNSDNLIEVIQAEDIGKLPDQNLAEVLENIPGIQITRTAGVGTGVQIRGTNANRTEINGVSTVGSAEGRTGIDFEDVSAGIISAVEVTKAPDAKTIEGSVGGTINLITIRPLDLEERLGSFRAQFENSSLTPKTTFKPRISGALGDNWETDYGDVGLVISGSWSEQDVRAFRPRTDRDNNVAANSGVASAQDFSFLPIQFLIQDYDNYDYETLNLSATLEFAPNENTTLYFDAVINDQESRQQSSRIQASGISGIRGESIPSEFETVNFGSLNGRDGAQNLGNIMAAARGVIPLDGDGSDGNLRFSGDTNSRLTDSQIFRLGANWKSAQFSGRIEASTSNSDTTTPSFNTTLNFINPNSPLDGATLLANHRMNVANADNEDYDDLYASNENGTPFVYDLRGGALTWAVAQDAASGPTTDQLLDPANVVLRDVNVTRDVAKNKENAFRLDFSYDLVDDSSFDFGYRYNETSSLSDEIRTNVGLRSFAESPRGDQFESVITTGPNNFGDGDGRELFVGDFLLIDPAQVAQDQEGVLTTLNEAIVANNAVTGATRGPISSPTSSTVAFFDITEKTNSFYGQVNFQSGIFRGNVGLRYIDTSVSSTGNTVVNNEAMQATTSSSYDFLLPRINLAADVHEDVVVRASYSRDIRRPDFDNLSTSLAFSTSPNNSVEQGNPGLTPEEVDSFDLSAEWYFAPGSLVSIGLFYKERTGLFVETQDDPAFTSLMDSAGQPIDVRDITAPCEGGGIFNPIADQNVFAPLDANGNQTQGVGVCVPLETTVNGTGETIQKGIELIFQYDFAQHEDKLGWASGFGILANLTVQKFSGPDTFQTPTSRAAAAFALSSTMASDVSLRANLIDLSETAYNITGYYEKYGISARLRYTWREAYRSDDFGSTSSLPWGFPVIQEDRGQLNASINYDVTDYLNVGVEAINLTESDVVQSCVNSGALLCYQGLTDRRIILGASYRY